jgi:hypothetical protein
VLDAIYRDVGAADVDVSCGGNITVGIDLICQRQEIAAADRDRCFVNGNGKCAVDRRIIPCDGCGRVDGTVRFNKQDLRLRLTGIGIRAVADIVLDGIAVNVDQTPLTGCDTDAGIPDRQRVELQIKALQARLDGENGKMLRPMSVEIDVAVIEDERCTRPVGVRFNLNRFGGFCGIDVIRLTLIGFDGQISGIGDVVRKTDCLLVIGHAVTDRTEIGIAYLGRILGKRACGIRLLHRIRYSIGRYGCRGFSRRFRARSCVRRASPHLKQQRCTEKTR